MPDVPSKTFTLLAMQIDEKVLAAYLDDGAVACRRERSAKILPSHGIVSYL